MALEYGFSLIAKRPQGPKWAFGVFRQAPITSMNYFYFFLGFLETVDISKTFQTK